MNEKLKARWKQYPTFLFIPYMLLAKMDVELIKWYFFFPPSGFLVFSASKSWVFPIPFFPVFRGPLNSFWNSLGLNSRHGFRRIEKILETLHNHSFLFILAISNRHLEAPTIGSLGYFHMNYNAKKEEKISNRTISNNSSFIIQWLSVFLDCY